MGFADAPDGEGRCPEAQVEDGAKQDSAHTAEAIEKCLGDSGAKERHAKRQPADQDASGAQRGAQLNRPGFQPGNRGTHFKKSYSVNVGKNQRKLASLAMIGAVIPASVRRKVSRARVGHFASTDGRKPALVPVCFVVIGDSLYHAIDAKPKSRDPRRLQRVLNIKRHPNAALLVDHYEEDWRRLWFVLFSGTARVITRGLEHRRAIRALRRKYPQYRTTVPLDADALIIAIDVQRLSGWRSSSPGRRASLRRDPPA